MHQRMSVSMTSDDRALIETAAKDAGVSVSAWMVQAAREEARWAVARKVGALLKVAARQRIEMVLPSVVLAQVWRDGSRQAVLSRSDDARPR
jgi:uncharacterized protein (DUF1778 family)